MACFAVIFRSTFIPSGHNSANASRLYTDDDRRAGSGATAVSPTRARSGARRRRFPRNRLRAARTRSPRATALEYRVRRRLRVLPRLLVGRSLRRDRQRPPDGTTGDPDPLHHLRAHRDLGRRRNDPGDDVLRPRGADADGVPARGGRPRRRRRVRDRVVVDHGRDARRRVRRDRLRARDSRADDRRGGHLGGVRRRQAVAALRHDEPRRWGDEHAAVRPHKPHADGDRRRVRDRGGRLRRARGSRPAAPFPRINSPRSRPHSREATRFRRRFSSRSS